MQIIKAARGGITGHFGDKNVAGANVASHGGMDVGHGDQTPADLLVVAPAAGRVTFVGFLGTYGRAVIIDHGNGYESLLAHLAAAGVTPGDRVGQGVPVATMGNTGGNWPVHLHQELRRNGVQLDPEKYLAGLSGPAPTPIPSTSKGHPEMNLMRTTDGTISLVTSQGIAHISQVSHVQLFERMFEKYPSYDTFNTTERQIILGYIHAASTADDAETAKMLAALSKVSLDPAPIVAAVQAAIAKAGVKVDAAAIAKAVLDAHAERLRS